MNIIQAGVEHVEQAAGLFDQYRVYYGQPSDLPGARHYIRERMERGQSVIFLACNDGGEAVGFMQLYPSFSSLSMRRVWILNDLFVAAEARGRGAGRRLLEAARGLALETEAKGLELCTAHDNATAKGLYESFGFRKDDHFDHYFFTL